MHLTLGLRIFIILPVLIALSVAVSVGVTYTLGSKIAQNQVDQALNVSATVQSHFQKQRNTELILTAELMNNPDFIGYIESAIDHDTPESIADQLIERRDDLGLDFIMLLDDEGFAIVHSDRPGIDGRDYSQFPIIAEVVEELIPVTGMWLEAERLFQVAIIPLGITDLSAFLMVGSEITDILAHDITKVSGSEVLFVAGNHADYKVIASTFDTILSKSIIDELAKQKPLATAFNPNLGVQRVDIRVSDERWVAAISPLDLGNESGDAALLAVSSLEKHVSGYRKIQNLLLISGVMAITISLAISFFLSKGLMRPLKKLSQAAQSASQGDYHRSIRIDGNDEIASLSQAFDKLLSDLREKQDIENYVADLSRHLPDPRKVEKISNRLTPKIDPPQTRKQSLLGIDLRHFAFEPFSNDPDQTQRRLNRDMSFIDTQSLALAGKILNVSGHRVSIAFVGKESLQNAYIFAGDFIQYCKDNLSDLKESSKKSLPSIALTEGSMIIATSSWGNTRSENTSGRPVHYLSRLVQEARGGQILLDPHAYKLLKPTLDSYNIKAEVTIGGISNTKFCMLKPEAAAKLPKPEITKIENQALTQTDRETRSFGTELALGTMIHDRYEILSPIGSGGMGIVYKAQDHELGDLVALKMLRSDVANDQEHIQRLKSEIKLARKITHPNVLRTFDFGEYQNIPYISMEYVRGMTLRYLLKQTGRLPYSAGLRIARQLSAGLEVAHEVGVLHRDIKPENLILESNGNAKLMDFGIARPIRRTEAGQTRPGMFVGTPHYAAPEHLKGEDLDARADIFSAGILFNQMFTGELPFKGENTMEIYIAHVQEAPEKPSIYWPEIPQEMEKIILKCLAKDPDERFPTATALGIALAKLRA